MRVPGPISLILDRARWPPRRVHPGKGRAAAAPRPAGAVPRSTRIAPPPPLIVPASALQTPASPLAPATVIDGIPLYLIDGEPRVRDVDLARALGYKDPKDIRKLIGRAADELRGKGDLLQLGADPAVP